MARYVTSGARYNPFDFNAMWKAAEAATQAHYAQGAQYATLAEQISPLESLKYNPVDANDYAQVQQYNQQLNDSLAKFQKNGLSGGSFQDFLQLSKNYATNIKPIEIEVKLRAEFDNILKQIAVNDHTAEFVKKGSDIPLSEFAKGSVMPEFVSGDQVQKQVALIVSKFAQQSGDQVDIESLNKYYDVIRTTTGLTYDQVLAFMKDPNMSEPKAQILNSIVQGVLGSTKGFDRLNPEAQARITQQAMNGVWNAVGTQQRNVTKSNYFDEQANARGWAQIKTEREQQALANELTKSKIAYNYSRANGNYDFSTGPIIPYGQTSNTEKVDQVRTDYNEFMQYKRDLVKYSKGELKKHPHMPSGYKKSGLSAKDYEAKITKDKDNTVFENQRYHILPNSDKGKDEFYSSFFNNAQLLNTEVTQRGGSSKTTLSKVMGSQKGKSKEQYLKYLRDNFTVELDYGTATPDNGLIIRNAEHGQVYYMPYSAFGSIANNLIKTQLEGIKRIKEDPAIPDEDKATRIGSNMETILNIIYSRTIEPDTENN